MNKLVYILTLLYVTFRGSLVPTIVIVGIYYALNIENCYNIVGTFLSVWLVFIVIGLIITYRKEVLK